MSDKSSTDTPLFDHEKLDVYQVELSFISWITPLIGKIKERSVGLHREVCDQLDRASLSMLLNTAEGNGKRQRRLRARFFDDARGSAVECAACLDALVAKQLVDRHETATGKSMLVRIVSMLTKLVSRFDVDDRRMREEDLRQYGDRLCSRPRSDSVSHGFEDEDEDEEDER